MDDRKKIVRAIRKAHREWQDQVIAECRAKSKTDEEFSSMLFDAAVAGARRILGK